MDIDRIQNKTYIFYNSTHFLKYIHFKCISQEGFLF